MSPAREDALRWASQGTARVERAVQSLESDEQFRRPSALPGWTRKHLIAHLAANADALCNLVHWAKTGEVTPMYASPAQCNADIEAGSAKPGPELDAWFDRSAEVLEGGWASMTDEQWDAPVVTAQGRTVPASETPWMRAREVMVHAVDLDAGVTFDDLPDDFCAALITDIVGRRSTAGNNPALDVAPEGVSDRWTVEGEGRPVVVTGPLTQVAAYLAGRPFAGVATESGEPAPDLPPWL